MNHITDSIILAEFCHGLSASEYVTVDTEFVREKTFWPQLCLVQLAGANEAAVIDPLAPGMDITPIMDLMANKNVLKVFHSARQDIEIFVKITGKVPSPLFDTQVAAMACGFGDSVSYENLVAQLVHVRVDKSMRVTDWLRRPLSEKQLEYALSDVTHLRQVYEELRNRLNGRKSWIEEEMAILTNPATYFVPPEEAWKRHRIRSSNPRFLVVLKALSAWREEEARSRDVPRQRIIKDDTLLELAAHAPVSMEELGRSRGFGKTGVGEKQAAVLLKIISNALESPEENWPRLPEKTDFSREIEPIIDFLKVLLKVKADQHGVAQRLIASVADIELIAASDEADVAALKGWRREIFGDDALRLKHGKIALALDKHGLRLVEVGS